ncbi:RTA1 like protein-domain-containing protein [Aspergillus varians]
MPELQTYRGYYLWHYVPSRAAAVVFLLLFLAATAYHTWKIWKLKTYFCICFAIGGFCYCARTSAYDKTGRLMPFCIQNVFILLGPALFAASIYMALGRIMIAVRGERHSLIPVRWLTKVFVTGDVLSFLIQGGAAGMMISSDLASMGNKLVILGLIVQVVFLGFFIASMAMFQLRIHRNPTHEAVSENLRWKWHLNTLYLVSLLIMVRSLFRAVEYIMGNDGYLLQQEWPAYVFDATLMWIVMVIFGVRFPSDVCTRSHVPERVQLNEVGRVV